MRSMSTPERLLAQGERGRFLAGHESLEAEESQEEYSASRVPASRDREEGVCPGVTPTKFTKWSRRPKSCPSSVADFVRSRNQKIITRNGV